MFAEWKEMFCAMKKIYATFDENIPAFKKKIDI